MPLGSENDLDGMARALLRRGVTSFLPTGVTSPLPGLRAFADRVRAWIPAALARDEVYVELIADRQHVHPALWGIVRRTKPLDRLVLISDALALAGTGDGRMKLGGLDVTVRGDRCTLSNGTLAGSVMALDTAVRNTVAEGASLPAAVAAASRNPLDMLGFDDRGRIATGQRADLVELEEDLSVRRVMRGGIWHAG